jgi:hypothetical protein
MERTMKGNEYRLKPTVYVEAVPELAMLRRRLMQRALAPNARDTDHGSTLWADQPGPATRDERRG